MQQQAAQDMVFMELMQDSVGKRERAERTSYNERDFHRGQQQVRAVRAFGAHCVGSCAACGERITFVVCVACVVAVRAVRVVRACAQSRGGDGLRSDSALAGYLTRDGMRSDSGHTLPPPPALSLSSTPPILVFLFDFPCFAHQATVSIEKSLPKAKKIPDMKDFQLFDMKRIVELYESEHARETKKAKALQRAVEAGVAEPASEPPTEQARKAASHASLRPPPKRPRK